MDVRFGLIVGVQEPCGRKDKALEVQNRTWMSHTFSSGLSLYNM